MNSSDLFVIDIEKHPLTDTLSIFNTLELINQKILL